MAHVGERQKLAKVRAPETDARNFLAIRPKSAARNPEFAYAWGGDIRRAPPIKVIES